MHGPPHLCCTCAEGSFRIKRSLSWLQPAVIEATVDWSASWPDGCWLTHMLFVCVHRGHHRKCERGHGGGISAQGDRSAHQGLRQRSQVQRPTGNWIWFMWQQKCSDDKKAIRTRVQKLYSEGNITFKHTCVIHILTREQERKKLYPKSIKSQRKLNSVYIERHEFFWLPKKGMTKKLEKCRFK